MCVVCGVCCVVCCNLCAVCGVVVLWWGCVAMLRNYGVVVFVVSIMEV